MRNEVGIYSTRMTPQLSSAEHSCSGLTPMEPRRELICEDYMTDAQSMQYYS
jgi:hypothetical protein